MGMCLDITLKMTETATGKKLGMDWVEERLSKDFPSGLTNLYEFEDNVIISYEGSYTGGVNLQLLVDSWSKDYGLTMDYEASDYEGPNLLRRLIDGECVSECEVDEFEEE